CTCIWTKRPRNPRSPSRHKAAPPGNPVRCLWERPCVAKGAHSAPAPLPHSPQAANAYNDGHPATGSNCQCPRPDHAPRKTSAMAYYRTPHDVTALPAWQALQQHRDAMQGFSMREAFAADAKRFDQFSLSACGLFLDYSKNL